MTWLTAQQFAGFRCAVTRASRGQVTIPDVVMTAAEAIALWRDVSAAFGAGTSRPLTSVEVGHLRRRAWRRSRALANLAACELSLDAGLAFWRLAGKLEALAARRKSSPLSRAAGAAVLGLAATQMAACTTFLGSNIKGSFSCSAPGGTCAPSTVIDDQALSVIQNARPMTPSGPYFQPPARRAAPVSARAPSGRGRMAAAGEGMVQRERRVLKVVFPSYVDGAGNLHEPRVVHTVADEGAWMQLSSGEPNAGDQLVGRSAAPAARPDTLVAAAPLSSLPPAIAVPMAVSASSQAMTATPAAAGPPDPRLVAEARARGPMRVLPSPVDAIKAEVQARLAQTPKAPGSPSAVQPALSATAAPAAAAAQPAAQSAAQLPAPSAPAAPNLPTGFSGKVEE